MKKYAIITDNNTKTVDVALGTDIEFFKVLGMVEMDVEQAPNGQWYVAGYVPIDELKQAKINEFKNIRDTEEVKPIEYNGNLFDYDEKARDRINSAIIALDITGQSIEWTTADNTNVLVTADDLRGVIAAVAMRSNELHVKYRQLKDQVEACTTKEALEKIVWE